MKNKKEMKRFIAGAMMAMIVAGNVLGNISPIIASETQMFC